MKKILSLMAITLMVLTAAMSFTSCGDDDDVEKTSNFLQGTTWEGNAPAMTPTTGINKGDLITPAIRIVFKDATNCQVTIMNPLYQALLDRPATYSISSDSKTVTIIVDDNGTTFSTTATISGETMTYDSRTQYGTFTMKKMNY